MVPGERWALVALALAASSVCLEGHVASTHPPSAAGAHPSETPRIGGATQKGLAAFSAGPQLAATMDRWPREARGGGCARRGLCLRARRREAVLSLHGGGPEERRSWLSSLIPWRWGSPDLRLRGAPSPRMAAGAAHGVPSASDRRRQGVALGAGRGKGGGAWARTREVVYETSVGRLKQNSLVGKERMAEASTSDDEDEDGGDEAYAEPGTTRFRCRVMYDGTDYNGWQLQPHSPSIQGLLETVLALRMQQRVKVVGAGRTDTGVHARGQVVHFDLADCSEDVELIEHKLNRMLPGDVKVCGLEVAPNSDKADQNGQPWRWHAIYSAVGKLYTYRLYFGKFMDPLERHMRHFEYRPCDMDKLRQAAKAFEGTHDFAAFANKNMRGKAAKDAVRTVHKVTVVDEGGGNYRIDFELEGALYKMIRNIVGTILAIACGKVQMQDLQEIFEGKERCKVPQAAPACGLCLEEVYYDGFNPPPEDWPPPKAWP